MVIKKWLKRLFSMREKRLLSNYYKRKLTRSLKELPEHRKLSRTQKKEIQDFYKGMIGRKVSLYSHEYFYSRTGVYSKEYIPTNLYHVELHPKANVYSYRNAYADKNMIDTFLPDAKHPHTYLKNMNGYFYWENQPVTREEAIEKCYNLKDVLIKPSLEYSGHGVKKLDVTDGVTNIDGLTIDELFSKYKKNYQIQAILKQHPRMNLLNPTSVNTIRVFTYRSGMEILVIYAVVRIGRMGEVIDNQCAGGISAIIGEDGKLGTNGFSGYTSDTIKVTDSGTVLDGFEIPSFQKVLDLVKSQHYRLPFFNFIGWDIAIDVEGDPVIIEWNANTGLSQSAFGPGFGKYTERIIRELWPRENSINPLW